jgi:hypothetical protein
VPGNRGPWEDFDRLQICLDANSKHEIQIEQTDRKVTITVNRNGLSGLVRGLGDIVKGEGDYAIGDKNDHCLWFWWLPNSVRDVPLPPRRGRS